MMQHISFVDLITRRLLSAVQQTFPRRLLFSVKDFSFPCNAQKASAGDKLYRSYDGEKYFWFLWLQQQFKVEPFSMLLTFLIVTSFDSKLFLLSYQRACRWFLVSLGCSPLRYRTMKGISNALEGSFLKQKPNQFAFESENELMLTFVSFYDFLNISCCQRCFVMEI